MFTDLTERKHAEEALRSSEERFRLAACATHDVLWDWDIVNDRLWFSDRFFEDFGYERHLFPGTVKGWADLVHPEDSWVIAPLEETYRTNEYRLRRADGTWAHVTDRAYLIRDAAGNRIRKIGTITDVSQTKRAEEALRDSEQRHRQLFEDNLAGVFRSSANGKVLECNEAFCRMLGYSRREELYALDLRALYWTPEESEDVLKLLLERGQLISHEMRLRRNDGVPITVLANVSMCTEKSGLSPIVQGTMLDVSKIRKLEDQLLQAQKMEAVGKLAGGVAHDFNNLLMVIGSYSELLLESTLTSDQQRHVEQVQKGCRRAANLTAQLLAFSRQQVIAPRILDMNSLLREMEKMLPRLIPENIDVRLVLGENLDTCMVDPSQMQQVIMNLAVNARDAMPQGGRLLIETANVQLDGCHTAGRVAVVPGPYVMLAVSDSGTGMDRATQTRIFEPFFTTKELGRGTGLGLSIIYGIVKQNGGYIFVYSEPGCGTAMKVYLPSVEGAVTQELPLETNPDAQFVPATILLVEDEAALRGAGADFLRSRGYSVFAAASGEDALQSANAFSGRIHLLVTDVVMPGISGPELAKRMDLLQPGLKVIYMSGYTHNAMPQNPNAESAGVFLQKPFSFQTLAKKVAELLRSEAAAPASA